MAVNMALTSLLVCSDAQAVQVLSRILQGLGIAVESCGDLRMARARIEDRHFDALLVDCQDEPAAVELIAQARKTPANQNIVAGNMQIGQNALIPINAPSSYGINSRADYLTFDSTKILLLEYKNTIARVVAPANADISQYSANVASRHNGALNVLYADGHIEAKTAGDIDPNIPTYQASYWAP